MEVKKDNYDEAREHLKNLTDEQLKDYFWDLADQIVKPLVDLAYKNTSPSIERSILMRMGFSSIEASELVKVIINKDLISKGCGNVVYRLSKVLEISINEAGHMLLNNEGWDQVMESFGVNHA